MEDPVVKSAKLVAPFAQAPPIWFVANIPVSSVGCHAREPAVVNIWDYLILLRGSRN